MLRIVDVPQVVGRWRQYDETLASVTEDLDVDEKQAW
jgi:hypothetical protein